VSAAGGPPGARLAILSGASIGLVMAVQGVLPALPAVQEAFGISTEQAGLFTLAYVLPGVVLTIPLSVIGSAVSPRTVLAVSLLAYGVSGAAQAAVGSYEALLGLRLVQGVCFAAAMPLTLAMIGDVYGPSRQIRALSVRQTTITIGELALPLFGALLAVVSWQAPFLAQILVIPLGLAAFRVLDGRLGSRPPELGGARALASVVFRQDGAAWVMLMSFARFVFKFTFIGYVPILLVQRAGASVGEAGVVVTVAAAGTALTANRMPRLLRRAGPSVLAAAAAGSIWVALLALAFVGDWRLALLAAVVFGFGDGVLTVLQDAYVTRLWPAAVRPGAASVSQTARNVGKLASPLLMTGFLAVASLPVAFALMAAVAAVMVPGFAGLRRLDEVVGDLPAPAAA